MNRLIFFITLFLASLLGSLTVSADAANPVVSIETNYGEITLELDRVKAPITVDNFMKYIANGHYDGTLFHRVMETFMIQGGGFDENFNDKETLDPIRNEANNSLSNVRGSVAMARTNDPHSATAQFFINVVDNDFLNFTAPNGSGWGYTVFGKVTHGMDVVDKIRKVAVGNFSGHGNVPTEPVIITKVRAVE
ncbi:peptidyl-prolyl cis-trans isomerase [Gammaproteobacteria bacterium AH-315-M22]|nr:peptidyl-prolyl cis-trans isomerase [Gammaproteobacteria bacterium AH-315-M22]